MNATSNDWLLCAGQQSGRSRIAFALNFLVPFCFKTKRNVRMDEEGKDKTKGFEKVDNSMSEMLKGAQHDRWRSMVNCRQVVWRGLLL